jgi:hypothetical protein
MRIAPIKTWFLPVERLDRSKKDIQNPKLERLPSAALSGPGFPICTALGYLKN